jgi:butyryl-CoA dehydrogenase
VIVGVTLPDGKQLLLVLTTDRTGVTVEPPLPLASLVGSRTTAIHCDGVLVENQLVLNGPAEHVLGLVEGGGLETSNLALGLSEAAVRSLEREADRRLELVSVSNRFRRSVDAARARLHKLAVTPDADAVMAIRVECTRLALRASQAALVAAKGTGFVEPQAAQRWARQALFFLVWSCPRPVAAGVLDELPTGQ